MEIDPAIMAPAPAPLAPIANAETDLGVCPSCGTALALGILACPVCALVAQAQADAIEDALEDMAESADDDAPAMDAPPADAPMDDVIGSMIYAPGGMKFYAPDPASPYVVKKLGVVWGGRDLVGDTFTKSTDLGQSRSFVGMPVFYDHAQRGIKSQIGTVIGTEDEDDGIVFAIELDRNHRYVNDVLSLEHQRALGASTGAAGHLLQREGGTLKRWIVAEISLTPTPAEPRTLAAIKSTEPPQEDTPMGDEPTTTTPAGADIARLEASVKELRAELSEIKSMPAVKSAISVTPEALGGSVGGGLSARAREADLSSHHHYLKSVSRPGRPTVDEEYPAGLFGGFCKAMFNAHKTNPTVSRDAFKALGEVYGANQDHPAAKALGTQAGVSGAFLLPEQFIPNLMAIAMQNDALYGKTMVIPVDGGEIVIPALDPSTSYSAGQSAYYGGVTVTWGSDDDAGVLTEPKFKQVRLKTNAMKALTRVKNQLMMRSAIAIDSVVTQLIGGAIGRARDYALFQGTGLGQPMGFLNAAATIDVAGSAIDAATLEGMEDQVIPERDNNYEWFVHSKSRSAISALQQTNNTLVTYLNNLRDKPQQVILGRNVTYTDKLPWVNADVSNRVNLIDPSMIVVAEFQGIAIAVSDQARFEQDETVFRAILSLDAQPWLTNKIAITSTPDYVSGFVTI